MSGTPELNLDLIDAIDLVLSDMGPSGLSMCKHTKAVLRVAFEPYVDDELREFLMPIEDARRVIAEVAGQ